MRRGCLATRKISVGNSVVARVATPAKARMHKHPQSAVGPTQVDDGQSQPAAGSNERGSGKFRFWHDERRFKGPGDKCLVQGALFAAGGVRTGGYPKAAPVPGPLGFQRPTDWDLLWSPARTALKAAPALRPGQLISAMPGMFCITKKRRLGITLEAAYGTAAFEVVPLTFSLPSDLERWRAWLNGAAAAGLDPGPWMLKTPQHLGKGLCLLPGEEAFQQALRARPPPAKPWVVAQRYVADPLLVEGRKFGIRLWVLVTGVNPLRAYLHSRGLVLFSTHSYDPESLSDSEGTTALGHVTNYAQNAHGLVWELQQLREHLGEERYQNLWSAMVTSAARTVCAALGEMKAEHVKLKVPPHSTFELLGLDFLVDSQLHPWLLEVNGTPSLAVDHAEAEAEQLIHTQKAAMVRDLVDVLNCEQRFAPRYELLKLAAASSTASSSSSGTSSASPSSGSTSSRKARLAKVKHQLMDESEGKVQRLLKQELEHCGGFLPLMPHFPLDEVFTQGWNVPFDASDLSLRQQMQAGSPGQEQVPLAAAPRQPLGQQQQQQQGMQPALLQGEQPLKVRQRVGNKTLVRGRRRLVKRAVRQAQAQQNSRQAGASDDDAVADPSEGF